MLKSNQPVSVKGVAALGAIVTLAAGSKPIDLFGAPA